MVFYSPKLSYAAGVVVTPLDDSNNPIAALDENAAKAEIRFTELPAGQNYAICLGSTVGAFIQNFLTLQGAGSCYDIEDLTLVNGTASINVCGGQLTSVVSQTFVLKKDCGPDDYFHVHNYNFEIGTYVVKALDREYHSFLDGVVSVNPFSPNPISLTPQNPTPTSSISMTINGVRRPPSRADRNTYKFTLTRVDNIFDPPDPSDLIVQSSGQGQTTFGPLQVGDYVLKVDGTWQDSAFHQVYTINIATTGGSISGGGGGGASGTNRCSSGSCPTAIGSIPTDPRSFADAIIKIALGLAGGIALIIMVVGSIRILMASGDQEKIAKGRDMLIAAVAGLLFLIFSILILRFIGSDLLGLGAPFAP